MLNRQISFVRCLLTALALALFPMAGMAQDTLEVRVFTDTTSVRVELEVAGAGALAGAPVSATIRAVDGGPALWSGDLGHLTVDSASIGRLAGRVDGLRPQLWSPGSPQLYHLEVRVGEPPSAIGDTVRFGFRSFEAKDGRLLLNGRPIFLRGNAINPPGRSLPEHLEENRAFVEDYVRYMKSVGVNIIRISRHSDIWFDVCDELGMMVFQGRYGPPKGGRSTRPPDMTDAEAVRYYQDEVLGPLVNHPSVVVYVLSNEQASEDIPYLTQGADAVERFLTQAYRGLRAWDDTRAYIGNAGYGIGRSGDISDIHRYWGWYYNSFLSYYTLRDPKNYWRSERIQPITLSENTGNYTGPDGRFNLESKSKQPGSQLNWTGHAPDDEQAERALRYQAFVARQAIEITRRIRSINPYAAGLMPFSIAFHRWWAIESFADMGPKPIMEQFAISYQPVLLSWELWTPQVYAGATIHPVAHVVNDSESGANLEATELHYRLTARGDTTARVAGRTPISPLPYYQAAAHSIALSLPADLPTGRYTLSGVLVAAGDTLSWNETEIFVAAPTFASGATEPAREVLLFDPEGATARALRHLEIPFRAVTGADDLDPGRHLLVLGARSWTEDLARDAARLRSFVAAGGRILILEQAAERFDASWLPAGVRLATEPLDHALVYPGGRPFRQGMAINPERPDHPVFSGVTRDHLFLWSDPTGWDESRPGFPAVYPVTGGFVLTDPDDLARTAVLANYDHGLEGTALAEMFDGRGSVLLSGFRIVDRVGLDPVADRMLANLVAYQASPEPRHPHPLVERPIVWGDYESERGVVTGIHSGLILHTVPVVPSGLEEKHPPRTDELGFHFAGRASGWASFPAVQYVGKGRRVFGPYTFSLGGSVQLPEGHAPEGEGHFWVRVPAGRTRVVTTVRNPVAEPLELEVEVNGTTARQVIPGGRTARVESVIPDAATTLAVTYRADRRLVLLETDFR